MKGTSPKRFAVIGNPIEHSLSPVIHQHFAKQTNICLSYEKIKGDNSRFEQQVKDFFIHGGQGLNVTLPFKQRAFALAQKKTPRCQQAGVANTLWLDKNQLHADNTDGLGLLRDLTPYLILQGKNILILGAGGAARGIIPALLTTNPTTLTIANRTPETVSRLQRDFPAIQSMELDNLSGIFHLIINATSASLEGETLELPASLLSQKPLCYDLAYLKNKPTPFVAQTQRAGCKAMDGLGMLVQQAAESFFIWNQVKPETSPVLNLLR